MRYLVKVGLTISKNLTQNPRDNQNLLDELKKLEGEKIYNELDYKISNKEISDAISTLKNGKASGYDIILNEMLKNSQGFLLDCLNKVFNTVLTSGSFPKIWAKGYIVPIFKNGSKDDPANYRGITIGSNLGKLFTKILNTRLEKYLCSRNIICPEQIGFSKGKRTTDHMFVLKILVDKYTQLGQKKLFSCFIDFKKAFDTVQHYGLLYKLRKAGISDHFYTVIKNMYQNTYLSVKVNNDFSTNWFSSKTGVRQGDNLSPTLFKLFINEIPSKFDSSCCPVDLDSKYINCLLYADDLILLSETADGLQHCLDILFSYCKKWGLEVNLKKSKVLVFNNTGRLMSTKFMYNSNYLENVRKYTYLGVSFSISGNFTDAKHELYCKGLKAFFKYLKCFDGHKPKLKTLIHVFDHTVKPILMYGSEIWGYFPSQKLINNDEYFYKLCSDNPIEKLHIKFCKYLLGVKKRSTNIAVTGELGRYPLFLEIIFNMIKYWIRLKSSDNILLKGAFSVSQALCNEGKQSWVDCIQTVFKYFNIDPNLVQNLKTNLKKYIFNKLHNKYNFHWQRKLSADKSKKHGGNKLRTYRRFKKKFCMEPYLLWGNNEQRTTITKFRISAHDLEIERGRYYGTEVDQRICKLCKTEVEDETHFLLQCPQLNTARNTILNDISLKYKNFNNLNTDSKFIWLMSSEDQFIFQKVYELLCSLLETKKIMLSPVPHV